LDTSAGTAPTVTLNGTDISAAFASAPQGSVRTALVTGLKVGSNQLVANVPGAGTTSLTITDTPITGPLFSGVQQTPFICQTNSFTLPDGSTLGAPTDANCSVPTKVIYIYKTTAGAYKPFDASAARPADMAQTFDHRRLLGSDWAVVKSSFRESSIAIPPPQRAATTLCGRRAASRGAMGRGAVC
jgi:hypothetical protein